VAALNGGTTLTSGTYGYDNAGRLSTVTDATLNSTYSYLANSSLIGQITHRQNSTVRMTETRQYGIDQLESRGVPGAFDVLGIAHAQQTVSVNGAAVDYRRGEYFQKLVTVNNMISLVSTNIPVTTSGGGSASGKVYVPQTPEVYQYDLDGNLLQDGRWTYTWDAENRLIKIESLAAMPEADKRRGNYAYDHQGRRIWKRVDYRSGGNWITHHERKFVYDGWNLTVELFTNNTAAKKFLWGLDLSGSEQGAGGVGGLLKVWDHYTANHCFVGYDGNGNVAVLTMAHSGEAGQPRAQFEYGPFGEPIRSSGTTTLAANDHRGMPFRFSTKYTDQESDLVYYGYRYYNPWTGSWPNRDPIGERGGPNQYVFARNSMGVDLLGLVNLTYINRPQWAIEAEHLWVGHYLSFDPTDAKALRRGGTLLLNHRSAASIADCETGRTLTSESKDLYFANRFSLNTDGSLKDATYSETFTDGQLHLFFQMAHAPMRTLYRESPGFSELSRTEQRAWRLGAPRTKGTFRSVMRVRVIDQGVYDISLDHFQRLTSDDLGKYRMIDGHEAWGAGHYYDGVAEGAMPGAWAIGSYFSETIVLHFEWNNCCSDPRWDYTCSAQTSRGFTRKRNADASFDAVDLDAQPRSR
jgi:RHS repeat-associated protein